MSDFSLDIRTAVLSYILITVLSTIVIIILLKQYRNRYKGVKYMLYCFGFQTVALILILLRGIIPDLLSFDLANIISVTGILFFFIGIEDYIGIKNSLVPSLIILSVFVLIHIWIIFLRSYTEVRHLNISILWLSIFVQCSWSLLYRIPRSKLRLTLPVSLISIAFCLVFLAKIIKLIVNRESFSDYLEPDMFDTVMIFISQILLLLLTFSLQNMFGSQLMLDIKAEEEKFSKAFNTSPYGVVITRFSTGEVIDINRGFQDITGASREDVLGKRTEEFGFTLKNGTRELVMEELKKSGRIYGLEFQMIKKSGEKATCLVSSEVISINNEKCILSSIDDITERKKYEMQLIASKEKAEESDRFKTAFLQNISHEIRTPLNAIVGFSTLLSDEYLDKESKQSYMDMIFRNSDHLLSILNDIMEISNIEDGTLKFNRQKVNISVLLEDLYKQYYPKAQEKGIDLRITSSFTTRDKEIQTDGTKLLQVLSNLLNNALKFTDSGRIRFGYEVIDDQLQFHVEDTGIGIPEDMFSKIFDRFYQIDSSRARQYPGTGLGLAISKAFVEFLGGKIWLKSTVGRGTAFYFTIPRVHF